MLDRIGAGLAGSLLEKPFQRAVQMLNLRVDADDRAGSEIRCTIIGLIKLVLGADRSLTDADVESVRHLLRDLPPHEISTMLELLREAPALRVEEALPRLAPLPEEARRQLVRELTMLAVRVGRLAEVRGDLAALAAGLGWSGEEFDGLVGDLCARELRRRKILKSGAGIAVALIVIVVFILTATLLRSVIFGLIAAYIMLPVEKYFERRLANRRTLLYAFFQLVSRIREPLAALPQLLRRGRRPEPDEQQRALRERRRLTARAVSLTCGTVLLVLLAILTVFGRLSAGYVAKLKPEAAVEAPAPVSPPPSETVRMQTVEVPALSEVPALPAGRAPDRFSAASLERFFAPVLRYLDNLRSRFDRMPLVQTTLAELARMLNDEGAQRELVTAVLKRTGGLFSFTAGLLGALCNLLLDVLLTIFFFMLFLTKLAEFCGGNAGAGRQSEYLVRTVFNGKWLPGAGEETVAEAERIISEVICKLKVWMRGYLSLVLLDATVYTTLFYFLRVPYFFILGPLAGCGILLPYIGPIASALVTLLVTLAVGGTGVSSLQIFGIISAYLLYNGVIEQFILYPMVIGESLGLSTLETIIVVLLGAIFAGISGMILALPAAAVLKYLVPQIYHCFDRSPLE